MDSATKKYTIGALVANKSGVLTRISGLFSRRGYNIESLTVCATEDPDVSRMTIILIGDEYMLYQMIRQMDKLEGDSWVLQGDACVLHGEAWASLGCARVPNGDGGVNQGSGFSRSNS